MSSVNLLTKRKDESSEAKPRPHDVEAGRLQKAKELGPRRTGDVFKQVALIKGSVLGEEGDYEVPREIDNRVVSWQGIYRGGYLQGADGV